MNTPDILLHPGLYNSGPEHWQSHWELQFGFTRILQNNWQTPVLQDWLQGIDAAVAGRDLSQVILAGHSLACCTIAHWAHERRLPVKGALLVAPSDVEAPSYPPGTTGFSPMPLHKLPFPSIVVASSNDEYVTPDRATAFAEAWGSRLVNVGDKGHINSSSGLGSWPEGLQLLQQLY
ncbi:MAG: serine hydrolase family protein [Chitinophagaceae bacterium]|nr:serine hydrolase family protein [Chitinophagaceae bacterium]